MTFQYEIQYSFRGRTFYQSNNSAYTKHLLIFILKGQFRVHRPLPIEKSFLKYPPVQWPILEHS